MILHNGTCCTHILERVHHHLPGNVSSKIQRNIAMCVCLNIDIVCSVDNAKIRIVGCNLDHQCTMILVTAMQ